MTQPKGAAVPDPLFTPEQVRDDGQNRVAKTGLQVGTASAVVIVATFIAHQFGWHGELTVEEVGAFVTLLSVVGSGLTNLGRLRAK